MSGGDEIQKAGGPILPPSPGDLVAGGAGEGESPEISRTGGGVVDPGREGDHFLDAATDPAGVLAGAEILSEPARPISRADPIAQNAGRWGNRTAIVFGDIDISYAELDERGDILAGQIARYVRGHHQGLVGLFFSRNRPEFFEIALAAKRAGASYTHFNSYLSLERLLAQLFNYPSRLLFVDQETYAHLDPHAGQLSRRGITLIDIDNHSPGCLSYNHLFNNAPRPEAASPDMPVTPYPGPVMYTSGTTDVPARILIGAGKTVGPAANRMYHVGENDVHLVV